MMRLLAGICGLALLLNIGLYLWPTSARTASHIYTPQPDVNSHFIRLNKEVEEKFYLNQSDADFVEGMRFAQANGNDCYRIGPFMYEANFELAQAVLFNANVKYSKSKRVSKPSDVYRVYIGPYSSKAEADDARVELKRKSILDHFSRQEPDGQLIISLGIYSTQESALTAVSLFEEKLQTVKMKQENVVLPDASWLYFSIAGNAQIHQQLARMDWGEHAAKLGEFDCQSI